MDAQDAWRAAEGPLLYAHRGASLEHPENTLPALSAALALGADALEIDAHLTRDGHVVIAHDPDVRRTAGVAGKIREHDLRDVLRWDVGAGFRAAHRDAHPDGPSGSPASTPSTAPARIPTLAEVLEALPDARLNIDLKQRHPSMARAAVECVHAAGAEQRVLLTSFSADTLAAVRAAGYRGPTGLSQRHAFAAVFLPGALLRRLQLLPGARLQIPPQHGPISLDRRGLLDKMHALGIAVDYWVVNDCRQAEALLELGADGLVTDDTRALATLFAAHPRTAGWRARHPALADSLADAPSDARADTAAGPSPATAGAAR